MGPSALFFLFLVKLLLCVRKDRKPSSDEGSRSSRQIILLIRILRARVRFPHKIDQRHAHFAGNFQTLHFEHQWLVDEFVEQKFRDIG